MLPTNRIPIVPICGFLGSGKTTILRRWQREEALKDAAVIVHDLSEFGLDAELLSPDHARSVAGRLVDRVAALHGRHAREQLQTSVGTALDDIHNLKPPPSVVLCESTGAARPWPLIRALTQDDRFFLRHFIVTVDALNLHRDFADGRALTGEMPAPKDVALRHAAEVLAEQIAFASVLILTKIDTVSEATVPAQVRALQKLQPTATVCLSALAGILLPQLEDMPLPDLSVLTKRARQFGLLYQSATAENVDSVVIRDPRPFHPQRLYDACRNNLGTGLYRTKGYVWLASRPKDVLLWQQSGSQISLEFTGYWRAEIVQNHDGRLLPEEIDFLREKLKAQHPLFGDRHNELTLIGLDAAREAFAASLQAALCTEEEVAAWQRGEVFPDPWPQSFRRVD